MEINNGVVNMGSSEHHRKVSDFHGSIDLEKHCDEDITGLQSFNE